MLISRDYAVQFTAALKTRVDIGKWKRTWHCFAIQPTSAGGYLSVPLTPAKVNGTDKSLLQQALVILQVN